MAHPLCSAKRAQALSTSLFLLGLAVLLFTNVWWPGIMLVVGVPLALRQYLSGRSYDMAVSLLVFVGTFISIQFDISWSFFLPIIFVLGAIYILCREFLTPTPKTEPEKEEDLNRELEELKKNKK